MIRKITLLLLSTLLTTAYMFAQGGLGTLKGTLIDSETGEPIFDATITLYKGSEVKGRAKTDFDGKFQINSIEVGSYDVEARNDIEQYQPIKLANVSISSNQIRFLNASDGFKLSKVAEMVEVIITEFKNPLINKDGGTTAVVSREDFNKMPIRSAQGVASTVPGVQVGEDGGMSIRGEKSSASYYFIDGIKVRGSSNLPKSAIEEVSVITGGVPASYGDITGGIVSITTRGPSTNFFGSVEAVTSGFYVNGKDPNGYDGKVYGLDKYGYNLFEGMLSGPLWKKTDADGREYAVLGFLASLNYTDRLDARPLMGGSYRIKKESRDALIENPLSPNASGAGTYSNALKLRMDDFEKVDWRMNARNRNLSSQFKIDVKTGPSINLTFGGSMNYSGGSSYSRSSSLLNFTNFGAYNSIDWRVFGRLTQRFDKKREEGSSSKISGAYYTLMVDYSQSFYNTFDPNHKYSLFDYGYVGKFDITRTPTYAYDATTGDMVQDGTRDVRVDFTPSTKNSTLAAITTQYYRIYEDSPFGNYENLNQIVQGNALRNGDTPNSVYNVWSNIGSPYNGFGKVNNTQFRFTGSGSVNIGDHSLTLGFEYEQRTDRAWSSGSNGPIGIWNTARLLANSHIKELDVNQATVVNNGFYNTVSYEQLNSGYAYTSGTGAYGGAEEADQQSFFDYNLRKALNLDPAGTDFLQVDAYDPSIFTIDMFSADELLNQGNSFISYYGYDYKGNRVSGKTDINDYFTKYDENGNFERKVGAFQPVYMSGYLMDKFAINDLIFNVGVRVDVFNANQPVLKDPFLLYDAYTVAEAKAQYESNSTLTWLSSVPSSMGDDYVVYVNDVNNPSAINGYRNGSTWYDSDGVEVSSPKVIEGAGGIAPYLVDPSLETPSASAFENYKAQVNVMPRISFSFPISEKALFFAHYDILTQRPTVNNRFDPFDYQFLGTRNVLLNNPNLKPTSTIDYEVGYQQVLTEKSSLKISSFYREQRNNIQVINMFNAYPATYKTYGNRDFGTVKGTTVSYDLRRTGNIRMTVAYTLQFANGTGSDENSSLGLINAGLPNLRSIFPYSYDRRHTFAITMDYRYGEGANYNGPVFRDRNILENTGLNLVTNIYSGSPYSAQNFITDQGSFSPQTSGLNGTTNGSRLPWSYRLDLQLDRTFNIEFEGKDENAKKKMTYLNVYVRVTNLFNQMNLLGVYRATGNWDDDGYLAAAASQTSIQNQLDEQSFRDYYLMKIQNPFNISSPRTIRLGVKFDF